MSPSILVKKLELLVSARSSNASLFGAIDSGKLLSFLSKEGRGSNCTVLPCRPAGDSESSDASSDYDEGYDDGADADDADDAARLD